MAAKKCLSKMSNNKKQACFLLLFLLVLVSSCVTQRKVEYVQDVNDSIKVFNEPAFPDYRLKSNDELYIQVNSLDEAATNIFSNSPNQQASNSVMSPYGASLLSYTIDKHGFVMLPVIGSIFVKDKTLMEVGRILQDSLKMVLSHPMVSVKLVNRYISVIGEVRDPGHFSYSQEKLSVYDALGLAGDITEYGNRNKVILLRNENSKNIRINLDLTNSEMLTSEYYFLRPNDIVYVKPLSNKFWGMRQFPFTVVFSTLTTALLIYNVFR